MSSDHRRRPRGREIRLNRFCREHATARHHELPGVPQHRPHAAADRHLPPHRRRVARVGLNAGYDRRSEESVESPTESAEVGDPLHLRELPAVLAQHPFVRSAVNLPEGFQRDLGAFLQDMAIIVQERDKLKEVIRQGGIGELVRR